MYRATHFHSTSHEVLCVFAGRAKLCFGGEENPEKVEAEVQIRDVIIVPTGVGHWLLEEDGDFQMIGSYPPWKNWDMCHEHEGEESKINKIASLKWFETDPLYGDVGPALKS